jgi:hypothetical protein
MSARLSILSTTLPLTWAFGSSARFRTCLLVLPPIGYLRTCFIRLFASLSFVMPGLVPSIHSVTYRACRNANGIDHRDKPGGDEGERWSQSLHLPHRGEGEVLRPSSVSIEKDNIWADSSMRLEM